LAAGFAASWSAPLDHAFLSPVSTLCGDTPSPPRVPFWVNCFVAPQPTARRCYAAGRHIARVIGEGPWHVVAIATGGLSHFPELSRARVSTSSPTPRGAHGVGRSRRAVCAHGRGDGPHEAPTSSST